MEVPKSFTFYGVRKPLPPGEVYTAVIKTFTFQERISKVKNNPYTTLTARVDINGQLQFLNLSLDPTEKDKSLYKLIEQVSIQTGKSVDELIELCADPSAFFDLLVGKTVKVKVNERGYLDVYNGSGVPEVEVEQEKTDVNKIDPADIPF